MKRALVTGGSGGIGAAICQRLARDGLHVFVHANKNIEKAEAVVAAIRRDGGSAEGLTFDVTDFDACEQALTALAEAGPIQVLVNNAGTHSDAPLAGMKVEQWRQVIDVSLHGFFNVTQPLLLPMIRTRWGRVISISSVVGLVGNRGQSNYAAAKAGLHGATKSLAMELATRGITANVVAPGIIAAGMGEVFTPETINSFVPMKRAGTAEEVASLVGYLASDAAAYITGQVLAVTGGVG
jgi:3-oxoacyl-[acyl-carrier protein] reductase